MILRAIDMGAGAPVVLLHGLFGRAENLGVVQRRLAATHRVLALDLRNHGQSPHAPGMRYADMAADVLETLHAAGALPCAWVSHSMGGKVAMTAALTAPEAVSRLVVADIAPTRAPPRFAAIVAAMQALPLHPGLTRAEADGALAQVVDTQAMRAFLLQNLRFGGAPSWRVGLAEIAAGLADIEDFEGADATPYQGRTLVIAGARSNYIQPEDRPVFRALFPAVKFVTLKDAGHWLHADNPAGFIAILQAFLGM
jgi:pimeloyl-ACP methyl ester carboxylesterase